MSLSIVPVNITQARAWVEANHSHHHAPLGGLCAVGVADGGRLVCVAVLSRPVARMLNADPHCAEVTRVASDGTTKHAASMSLGAIARAAIALGYRRLVSYTLLGEAGTSYRAAGWWATAKNDGGEWSCAARPYAPRAAAQPGAKVRWEFGPAAMPRDLAVDALVREHVGKVELRERPETLPLLARMAQ